MHLLCTNHSLIVYIIIHVQLSKINHHILYFENKKETLKLYKILDNLEITHMIQDDNNNLDLFNYIILDVSWIITLNIPGFAH